MLSAKAGSTRKRKVCSRRAAGVQRFGPRVPASLPPASLPSPA